MKSFDTTGADRETAPLRVLDPSQRLWKLLGAQFPAAWHPAPMGAIRGAAIPRTLLETLLSQAGSLGERPFLYFHQDGGA